MTNNLLKKLFILKDNLLKTHSIELSYTPTITAEYIQQLLSIHFPECETIAPRKAWKANTTFTVLEKSFFVHALVYVVQDPKKQKTTISVQGYMHPMAFVLFGYIVHFILRGRFLDEIIDVLKQELSPKAKAFPNALEKAETHLDEIKTNPKSISNPDKKTQTIHTPPKKKRSKKWLWVSLVAVLGSILLGGIVWLWEPWMGRFDHDDLRPTGTLNGYGYVDLGLSVKWATCNVGASTPAEYGNDYEWGETQPQSIYTEGNSSIDNKSLGDIAGNPNYDAARANWGDSWRMPTKAEFQELIDKCTWTWGYYSGIKGYKVTGSNSNSIFLPATVGPDIEAGHYWSSTPYESSYENVSQYAHRLDFYGNGYHDVDYTRSYYDASIRPVSE